MALNGTLNAINDKFAEFIAEMKKGEDYRILKNAGFPVPIYGVFDVSCLKDKKMNAELQDCVGRILTEGSGLVGVRTEPKKDVSILGYYPHYMPLHNFKEVVETIELNERERPEEQWWYLVNEAFLEYEWNAVVKLSQDGTLPGYWKLEGEVNITDNLPLRPALTNMVNVMQAKKWMGNDPAQVRKNILQSGLIDTWIEISKVRTPSGPRLVYWGLRGTNLE